MVLCLMLVSGFMVGMEFTLDSGYVIMGNLEGIKDSNMYIVDSENLLYIVPSNRIVEINAGQGDMSLVIKRRRPFMQIDPSLYETADLELMGIGEDTSTKANTEEQSQPIQLVENKQDDYNSYPELNNQISSGSDANLEPNTSGSQNTISNVQPLSDIISKQISENTWKFSNPATWFELGFAPFSDTPVSLSHLVIKWSDAVARVVSRAEFVYEYRNIYIDGNSSQGDYNMLALGIESGLEFHKFRKEIVSPYYGFLLGASFMPLEDKMKSNISQQRSLADAIKNDIETVYLIFSATAIVGCDYYFSTAMYVGLEAGYGLNYHYLYDVSTDSSLSGIEIGRAGTGLLKLGIRF